MWGTVISAGATLLGGLFGSKKQKTENTVDYVQMAKSAQAAGFNPLTALRNGGAAGFTTSTHHPGLSAVGAAIAGAGQQFGAALDQRLDPIEQKRNKVEDALLDYQLATIQSSPNPARWFGDVPSKGGRGGTYTPNPALSKKSAPKDRMSEDGNLPGEGHLVGGKNPAVSSLGLNNGRYGYFHAPWLPDAEEFEKVKGDNELNSMLFTVAKYANDIPYSIKKNVEAAYEDYGKAMKAAEKRLENEPERPDPFDGPLYISEAEKRWLRTGQRPETSW